VVDPAGYKLGWQGTLLIAAVGAVMLLLFLGDSRTLTQHEVWTAQPAREMVNGATWTVQTFVGEVRGKKTPAMSWLIAAAMAVTGSRSEWLVRLPSALCGVGVALVVGWTAARWMGRRAGVLAGVLLLTTFWLQMQARLAEVDTLQCLAVTGAFALFAAATLDGPWMKLRGWWVSPAFHALVAVSFVAKLFGPAFVLPACVAFAILARSRDAWRVLLNPVGLVVLILLSGAWPAAAYLHDPTIVTTWRKETLDRLTGDLDKNEPFLSYFWNVPLLLLPWLPFTVWGVVEWAGWIKRGETKGRPSEVSPPGDDRSRIEQGRLLMLIACWFVAGFVLLHASAFKHKHYAIPILPGLTLFTVVGIEAFVRWRERAESNALWWVGALAWLVACGGGVYAASRGSFRGATETAITIGVVGMLGLVPICFDHARRRAAQVASLIAVVGVAFLCVQALVLPKHDGYRLYADLAREANARVPAGQTVWLVGLGEAHIAYYIDRPLKRADQPEPFLADAPAGDAEGGALWVVCRQALVDDLERAGAVNGVQAAAARRRQKDDERLVLVRWTPRRVGVG
jgi:4-amino-4-deoxy-L-arabinose transferase-like glycosyltransferase